MSETPTVEAFLRGMNTILRDTLATLAADLDVQPSRVSIAFTYDDKTRSFGYRVGVRHPETNVLAYAFDPDMLKAVDELADGWRRLKRGEVVVDDEATDDEKAGRVTH